MFVTEVVALVTLFLFALAVAGRGEAPAGFILAVSLGLWLTVYFANVAEAMAEGRGKAQAESLRASRQEVVAKLLPAADRRAVPQLVPGTSLRAGQVVLVEAGDTIPGDGEIVEGIASVNESAITGESAPVIRESGGDRSSVTGGTKVLSDWIVVRITANPGETFLDRMIALVEGARRQKTPNEIALHILLVALTLVFLVVVTTLQPFSEYAATVAGQGAPVTLTALAALLVCLIPTTIGGLLSAIGIAGMDRMIQANVIATSGRAIEAAGDVDVLLLDKTGTITLGNRQAAALHSRRRCDPAGARRRGAAVVAVGRNARGAQHRRAGQGEVRPARARGPRARRAVRSVQRAVPDERGRPGRAQHPQGRGRRGRGLGPRAGREPAARACGGRWRKSPSAAPRRSWSPTARACWA